MTILEGIATFLVLIMIIIASLAIIGLILFAAGTAVWEHVKDKINIRRMKRK